MQVPRRKTEKYTHIAIDPHMTQEKFDELTRKRDQLLKKRPQLAHDVRVYAQNGDFSENAEYQIAKGRLRGLNQHIIDIEELLRCAVIITPHAGDQVQIGSTVTIKIDGKEKMYHILGSSEAHPEQGIISHQSPLGQVLLHKKTGNQCEAVIGGKKRMIEIIAVT